MVYNISLRFYCFHIDHTIDKEALNIVKCKVLEHHRAILGLRQDHRTLGHFSLFEKRCCSRRKQRMTTGRQNRSDIQRTLCKTEIPFDSCWIRISGHLLGLCNTIFIPELGYNGTIIDIKGQYIIVLPHDYGTPFRCLPSKLITGRGISSHRWLDQINMAFVDTCIYLKGTYP